jgi:predicted lipoprotein with Yx(FWY)xxD motif
MKTSNLSRVTSRLTLALAATAVFAAACGGSSSGNNAKVASNTAPSSASSSNAGAMVSLATHKGPAGTYLTDAKGRSLYLFAADSGGTSACNGACATHWPPLTGSPAQGSGAANGQTGTFMRGDGSSQITYAGHPLYYYAGDSNPGDTNGQGLDQDGGKWWLVAPSGQPLTGPAPAASSSSSTQSGWS